MLSEEDLQKIREIIEDVINKSDNMKKLMGDYEDIKEENVQMKDKINKVICETEKWRN